MVDGRTVRRRRSTSYKALSVGGRSVAVHRLRAEAALGKPLPDHAVVHHADGSRDENAPLVICENEGYHALLHRRMFLKANGADPNTESICGRCRAVKPRAQFTPVASMSNGVCIYCKACKAEIARARRAA